MSGSRCERLTAATAPCAGPAPRADRLRLIGAVRQQAQPLGAVRRRCRARSGRGLGAAMMPAIGTPPRDDREIDGELIAAGEEFLGAVERIDQDEAAIEGRRRLGCRPFPPRSTGTPGSSRARPCRITASEASSAAVTGDWSGLSRCATLAADIVPDHRAGARDDRGQFVQQLCRLRRARFRNRASRCRSLSWRRVLGGCAGAVYHARKPMRPAIRQSCSHACTPSGDQSMSGSSIEALDLAALLCSRVCHDLISPVGAIVNGLEVLEEDKDEETKTFALDLIKKSANTASAKLQFCRIAFGAAGSAGAQIDTRRCREDLARLPGGRQDQARLEPAARAAGQEPGQAAAQHAADRRADHPARRQAHRRSDRRGRHAWASRSAPPAPMPRFPRRCRRCSPARPAARRSTPTASSRSMPGCWPRPAASRPPWRWTARRSSSARQVSALRCGGFRRLTRRLMPRIASADPQLKLNPSPTHWPALPTESGRRAKASSTKAFSMDDLLREFVTETNESLDVVDVELVRFEQDPNNAKILDNIFRLVHTIKGTCGFLESAAAGSAGARRRDADGQVSRRPAGDQRRRHAHSRHHRPHQGNSGIARARPARAGWRRRRSDRRSRAHGRAGRTASGAPARPSKRLARWRRKCSNGRCGRARIRSTTSSAPSAKRRSIRRPAKPAKPAPARDRRQG